MIVKLLVWLIISNEWVSLRLTTCISSGLTGQRWLERRRITKSPFSFQSVYYSRCYGNTQTTNTSLFPFVTMVSSHEHMSQQLCHGSLRLLAVHVRLCGEVKEAKSVTKCLWLTGKVSSPVLKKMSRINDVTSAERILPSGSSASRANVLHDSAAMLSFSHSSRIDTYRAGGGKHAAWQHH